MTPLQLALAYAALGNGGTLYQPQVVRAVETSDGAVVQEFPPRIRRQVDVHPENLRRVTDALYDVVNDPNGTAYPARDPSLDVAGKTGHGADRLRREEGRRPEARLVPLAEPRLVRELRAGASRPRSRSSVLVEHGGSGPEVAVPVAMQIVHEYERLQAIRLGHRRRPSRPPPHDAEARRGPRREARARTTWACSGACASTSTGRCSSRSRRSPSSASSTSTRRRASSRGAHSDDYIQQIYWLVGGGILATVVAAIDYRHYERLGYALYGVGIVLLAPRLHPGARDPRQLAVDLHRLVQLPAERVHEALPRHRAGEVPARRPEERGPHAARTSSRRRSSRRCPTALVLLQPDLGTALILVLVFVSICALTRIQTRSLVALGVAGAIARAASSGATACAGYQNERINAWLNPNENVLGYNWDPHQARIAIGNGGWLGQGFMKGSQNQFLFLHEQHSDFPFPVFAEEWGFVGERRARRALRVPRPLVPARRLDRRRTASAPCSRSASGASSSGTPSSTSGMVTGLLPVVGVTLAALLVRRVERHDGPHRRRPRDERLDAPLLRIARPARRRFWGYRLQLDRPPSPLAASSSSPRAGAPLKDQKGPPGGCHDTRQTPASPPGG